jgi:hypothetical protein
MRNVLRIVLFVVGSASIFFLGMPPLAEADRVVVIPLSRTTASVTVPTVISVGQIWMDRNLGALRPATKSADPDAYGSLYQWGRPGDGHQYRTSPATTTTSSGDQPGHGDFIQFTVAANYDWRVPQNHDLWQGEAGINNPCPAGFRLPTAAEFETEIASWSSAGAAGALASPLKLPLAGRREYDDARLRFVGSQGYYWTVTLGGIGNIYSIPLIFGSGSADVNAAFYRSFGLSVRCIKD